jgi:hypothetical protein
MRAFLLAVLAACALQSVPAAAANVCGNGTLPTAIQGPVTTRNLQWGSGDRFEAKFWRIPCSQADSMLVMTVTPLTSGPFVCSGQFTILQNSQQTDRFSLRQNPAVTTTFCGDVFTPLTLAFVPISGFPSGMDMDGTLTLNFDGSSAGNQQVQIPAYDPGAYGPPVPRPTRNYTGQWHSPAEGGRGMSMIQFPNNVLFVLWFVYDGQGTASWYQLDAQWIENDVSAGAVGKWTGAPWGPTYDPNARVLAIVGNFELRFTSETRATLSYNVDGVARTMTIEKIQ